MTTSCTAGIDGGVVPSERISKVFFTTTIPDVSKNEKLFCDLAAPRGYLDYEGSKSYHDLKQDWIKVLVVFYNAQGFQEKGWVLVHQTNRSDINANPTNNNKGWDLVITNTALFSDDYWDTGGINPATGQKLLEPAGMFYGKYVPQF